MELGGAERALLGLLYAIDTDKVDVDLFINQHTGPFMKLIPQKINLLPEIPAYSAIERPLAMIVKEGHLLIAWGRIKSIIRHRIYKWTHHIESDGMGSQFVFDGVIRYLPSLHYLGNYDLAISFLDPPHIVLDKVLAKKRVEWIHTDFSGNQFVYIPEVTYKRWAANDYIISISDDVTREFLVAFPSLKDKIVKIENIIPRGLIVEQAKLGNVPEYQGLESDVMKLCSVGRLTAPKNFESIPEVAKILKSKGLRFKWIIVGPGDVAKFNNIAADAGVGECVSFIGPQDNPYPYMASCDIYVQPSRYEGKAVTVQEAQMLSKSVIITRYPTSGSQVVDGKDGVICEMDNQSIADAIYDMCHDKELRDYLGRNAAAMHCGNNGEIEKLMALIQDER